MHPPPAMGSNQMPLSAGIYGAVPSPPPIPGTYIIPTPGMQTAILPTPALQTAVLPTPSLQPSAPVIFSSSFGSLPQAPPPRSYPPFGLTPAFSNSKLPPTTYGTPTTLRVFQPTPTPVQQRGPTVYIGHLIPDTDDSIVRQLLSECGKVVRWSRTQDPSSRKMSTFGFCEFESPLGVIRAVRCLDGLILEGQALVANCEDKFKDGLPQWRKDRHHRLQEENPAKTTQEIDSEIEKEDHRTEQNIKRLAAEYNQKKALAAPEPDGAKPAPPSDSPTSSCDSRTPRHVNDNRTPRLMGMLDRMEGYIDMSVAGKLSYRDNQRIQRWNNRLKESRGEFRKRVQAWERKEAAMIRERRRRRETAEAAIEDPVACSPFQRKRLLELDLQDDEYYMGPDGTVWEGALSSRRYDERQSWLKEERDADSMDVLNEVKELEEKQRKETEQNEMVDVTPAPIEPVEVPTPVIVTPAPPPEPKPDPDQVAMGFRSLNIQLPPPTKKREAPVVVEEKPSVFGVEEEEEEIEHAGKKLTTVMDFHLDRAQVEAERETEKKKKELLSKISSQIPKTNEELFAFPVDWDLLHKKNIFSAKVHPWISKKVAEFLGEEEPELSMFIATRVSQAPDPPIFLKELQEFLDEDTEGFVSKLWKLLVFECLRLKSDQ